ncbi:MAG: cytochrome c maturation protein CcmE [Vicinamibacterales bacterium]
MKHKAVRIGLTIVVLAAAFGGLLYSTLSEGAAYYKHVDEVMVDPQAWHGKNLQLHGFVVPNSIRRRPDSLDWRFEVHSNGHVMQASYSGIVPDTFKDEAEVVLKGRLTPEGFHVAPDGVMAKCPSKYEAQPGAAGPRTGPGSTGTE